MVAAPGHWSVQHRRLRSHPICIATRLPRGEPVRRCHRRHSVLRQVEVGTGPPDAGVPLVQKQEVGVPHLPIRMDHFLSLRGVDDVLRSAVLEGISLKERGAGCEGMAEGADGHCILTDCDSAVRFHQLPRSGRLEFADGSGFRKGNFLAYADGPLCSVVLARLPVIGKRGGGLKMRLKTLLGIALVLTAILLVVYRDQIPQHGTIEFPNGTYTGQLFRRVPSGYGVFTSSSRDTPSYQGRWGNGVYHGRGTLTYANGKQMTGNFWNGVPDGVFHVTEPGGGFSTPRFSREEPWKGR